MKYLFLPMFLFLSQITYCCNCNPLGAIDDEQFNSYNIILKGKVTRIAATDFTKTIYVKVESYFKGRLKSTTIKIETPAQSGACGIYPIVGERWLMFASKKGKNYFTSLCTRTKRLNASDYTDAVKKELEFLERKKKGLPGYPEGQSADPVGR